MGGLGLGPKNPDDYYVIRPHSKFFALFEVGEAFIPEEDRADKLVCICVYKKGAEEVRRRLLKKVTRKEVLDVAAEPEDDFDDDEETEVDD